MESERKQVLEMLRTVEGVSPALLLPNPPGKRTIFCKRLDKSTAYREKGNRVFRDPRHDASHHLKIWKYYCYSIASAPRGSDALAFGYANRSALLEHLKKFEECVRDVDRALQVTKSDELKVKLLCRKTECLVALRDGKQRNAFERAKYWFGKVKEPKNRKLLVDKLERAERILELNEPDYNARRKRNIDVKCKNDAIGVNRDEKYGRHLLATRHIHPGEFVCMDKFYLTSVNGNKNFALCSHCLAISWATVPCDECAYAMYCSEECKQKAWELYHDIECSMQLAAYFFEDCINQMSIRALIMGYKEAGNIKNLKKIVEDVLNSADEKTKRFCENGELNNDNFKNLLSLSYLKKFNENRLRCAFSALISLSLNKSSKGKIFTFNYYKKLDDQKNIVFFASLLLRLISIISINSFGVIETTFICKKNYDTINCIKSNCCSRGLSYSPLPSLINHSCNSNVGRFYTNDGKVVYYANQPIKKGAQIFTSYYCHYFYNKSINRQKFLNMLFEFDCDCLACKNNWSGYNKIELFNLFKYAAPHPSTLIILKYENLLKTLAFKDHRSNHKTIKNFAEDFEMSLKRNANIHIQNQLFIVTLADLIEKRYGTVLRIPNHCKSEKK